MKPPRRGLFAVPARAAPRPAAGEAAALRRRNEFALRYLGRPFAELDATERDIVEQLLAHRPTSRDAAEIADDASGFWDRLADRVAAVGGSWPFIFVFSGVLLGWMVLNSEVLGHFGLVFDPYPYIFLNLMLSTVAALQAPVIMMSQNRQGQKDRVTAGHDYEVNLRAELEIARLHSRLERIEALLERRAPEPAETGSDPLV